MSAATSPIPQQVQETIALLRRDVLAKTEEAERYERESKRYLERADAVRREVAQKDHLADELEAAYGVVRFRREAVTPAANSAPVTIEKIRGYLADNGGRPSHLAKHFKVSKEEIEKLISAPDSKVKVVPRGWLKLQP